MGKNYFLVFFISIAFVSGAQNTWVQKANYGGGNREASCSFGIGTIGYIMTGLDVDTAYCQVWAWDELSNTWTNKNIFPNGTRIGASAVSLNGYGYLICGQHPSNCFRPQDHGTHGGVCAGTFYDDFWKYSPDSDSWTQLTNFPGGGRDYGVMVADPQDTAIFYGTGNDNGAKFLSDWWVYRINSATWTQVDSFPGGQRFYAAGFYANGNVYVGTGDNNDTKIDATNDMWQYNPISGIWKRVANVPGTIRRQAAAFSINNYGYICNGVYGTTTNTLLNDVWKYNTIQDTWTSEAAYPPGSCYFSTSFSMGNKGYIGTGIIGLNDTSSFWEYTPDDTVSGIANINGNRGSIKIFPNPSNGKTYLSYAGLGSHSLLYITDELGHEIDSREINNNQGEVLLDESGLSNGIYFYKLISENNSVTGKFIIAK